MFPSPKRRFPLRTANAVLMRAFRHLRDCDAALHRGRGYRGGPDCRSIHLVALPAGMAEIGSAAIQMPWHASRPCAQTFARRWHRHRRGTMLSRSNLNGRPSSLQPKVRSIGREKTTPLSSSPAFRTSSQAKDRRERSGCVDTRTDRL
jgi:hypothetical protein